MPSRTIYSDMQPNVLKLLQCCTFTKNNNNLLLLLNESNGKCMYERKRKREREKKGTFSCQKCDQVETANFQQQCKQWRGLQNEMKYPIIAQPGLTLLF